MILRCRLDRIMRARGIVLLGTVLLALVFTPTAHAQRMLLETLTNTENSLPIELFADHAATWTEAGKEVYLLRGGVVLNQGNTTIRSPDVVLWVDRSRFDSDRIINVTLFGDQSIDLERNKSSVKADYGYVHLGTSNRIELKVYKSKLAKMEVKGDRVYLKALANYPASPMKNAGDVRPAQPIPINPGNGGLQLTGGLQPVGPKLPPAPAPLADPKQALDQAPTPEPKKTMYFQVPPQPKVEPVPSLPGGGLNVPPAPAPTFSPIPVAPPTQGGPAKAQPRVSIRPRYSGDLQVQYKPNGDGTTAVIVTGTGGVMVLVSAPADTPSGKATSLDIEADRIVIWTRGNAQALFQDMKGAGADNGAHEIYMSGHVEIRTRTAKEVETLRADEVYYDVRRGVAVARKADLEIQSGKLMRPLRLWTEELIQVNPKLYQAKGVGIHNSILPSDPGLVVNVDDATVEEVQHEKNYLFGLIPAYDKDGKRAVTTERIFTGRNMVGRMEGVPIFYFPYLRDNIEDPLGPLEGLNFSYNQIFGMQFYTTWDIYDLLHLPKIEGTRWQLMADYLTNRGPALGTTFDFSGKELFGTKATYSGMVRLYGIMDGEQDILGGGRGSFLRWPDATTLWPVTHPDFRGQAFGKVNIQNLPEGFSVLGQFAFLSDRNFLEQFYLNTQLNEMNQDTYLYVKQQQDIWSWSLMGQVGTRAWLTQTDWLPKADGNVYGLTFLDDLLVYNGRASAGYAQLRPTDQVTFAYAPNDVRANSLRLDLFQDISLPFYLGPVKVAPYLVGDLAYYSQDVAGDQRGRLYGGAGVRWNMPLSRLFPDIQSELLNLNGIYHKVNLTGNYFTAASSSRYTNFPQFDRLNDDASDQALRDIRPQQTIFNPTNAAFLTTSPLFNPQTYAIRRLIDSNVDTLDQVDVLQLGVLQRWQTKRGFPGNEHVIDWMTFNAGVSIFPRSDRDNFGHTFGILEYDWTWNVGDRTALTSSGWFEPFDGGPRVFNFGAVVDRPDTSRLYIGYRQIDPLQSKAVVASIIYPFSAKYALTANTVWDFGVNVNTYSLYLSRMGTDVLVNFGVSFNSTVNTFGLALEIMPNLARRTGRTATLFPTAATDVSPMVNLR